MVSKEEQVVGLLESTKEPGLEPKLKVMLMAAIEAELMLDADQPAERGDGHLRATEFETSRNQNVSSVLALCAVLFVTGCLGWVGVESTPFITVQRFQDRLSSAETKSRLLELMPEMSEHSVQYFLRQ